jgi:DNA polymerase-3 subunit gamma/tau
LFDEVLSQGFDGLNFLTGLAEHLRNLLVCQDTSTLVLLETSETVKSRYQLQASGCKPVHLIKSLDILSETESKFRYARNQRLQVELALMQITLLLVPSDNQEKKNPELIQQQTAAVAQSRPAVVEAPSTPTKIMNFRAKPEIKTVSIKDIARKSSEQQKEAENQNQTNSLVIEDLPREPFEQAELHAAWKAYCDELAQNRRNAMIGNLTLGEPILNADYSVVYQVQNESQRSEIETEKSRLMEFLRKKLRNYDIKLVLQKSETPIKTRPYTPEEKLKALEEMNPIITSLKETLGLSPE